MSKVYITEQLENAVNGRDTNFSKLNTYLEKVFSGGVEGEDDFKVYRTNEKLNANTTLKVIEDHIERELTMGLIGKDKDKHINNIMRIVIFLINRAKDGIIKNPTGYDIVSFLSNLNESISNYVKTNKLEYINSYTLEVFFIKPKEPEDKEPEDLMSRMQDLEAIISASPLIKNSKVKKHITNRTMQVTLDPNFLPSSAPDVETDIKTLLDQLRKKDHNIFVSNDYSTQELFFVFGHNIPFDVQQKLRKGISSNNSSVQRSSTHRIKRDYSIIKPELQAILKEMDGKELSFKMQCHFEVLKKLDESIGHIDNKMEVVIPPVLQKLIEETTFVDNTLQKTVEGAIQNSLKEFETRIGRLYKEIFTLETSPTYENMIDRVLDTAFNTGKNIINKVKTRTKGSMEAILKELKIALPKPTSAKQSSSAKSKPIKTTAKVTKGAPKVVKKQIGSKPTSAREKVHNTETGFQIKTIINTLMHSKLHEQMTGEPTLQYQSGRFAESAWVEKVTLKGNQHGTNAFIEYNYQTDPYEVFKTTHPWNKFGQRNPQYIIPTAIKDIVQQQFRNRFKSVVTRFEASTP